MRRYKWRQDSRKVSSFSFPSLVFAINSHENVSQNRLSSVCPRTSSLWVNLAEITEGRIMKTLFRCEFVIKDRPTGWRSNDAKFTPACPCVKVRQRHGVGLWMSMVISFNGLSYPCHMKQFGATHFQYQWGLRLGLLNDHKEVNAQLKPILLEYSLPS